jgi:nitrogen regulatory protein P-II 2
MKMISAIIRSSKVESVASQLKKIGVSGCTVYPVRGYGEEWPLYEPLIHGGHHKLEAIVKDDQVRSAVKGITESAWTVIAGDGILSVFELDQAVHLRTKKIVA